MENRVFVTGRDGKALDPCCPKRARQLVESGRAKHAGHRPWTIQLMDRYVGDGKTVVHPHELRLDPGARRSGIAVVMRLEREDHVVYQEEITHRRDISERMRQRRGYRQGRRGRRWRRPEQFLNRRKGPDWRAPCIASVVANLEHRTARLAARSGAQVVRVEHAKFDLQKMRNPEIHGKEYQEGPLYKTHRREYIATQWGHRCGYCDTGDWEDGRKFTLDHVLAKSRGGTDDLWNLVYACAPCNNRKDTILVEEFLAEDPERLARILKERKEPSASATWTDLVVTSLRTKLERRDFVVLTSTGADTAYTRRENGIEKTHANDAACVGAQARVTRLRVPQRWRAVGHGRRQQAKAAVCQATPPPGQEKGSPGHQRKQALAEEYRRWKQSDPKTRGPAPGHRKGNGRALGIRSGDIVEIKGRKGWVKGRAIVGGTKSEGTHKDRLSRDKSNGSDTTATTGLGIRGRKLLSTYL